MKNLIVLAIVSPFVQTSAMSFALDRYLKQIRNLIYFLVDKDVYGLNRGSFKHFKSSCRSYFLGNKHSILLEWTCTCRKNKIILQRFVSTLRLSTLILYLVCSIYEASNFMSVIFLMSCRNSFFFDLIPFTIDWTGN